MATGGFSRTQSARKVILIGLDGANPGLLRSYADQGVLPNIARLIEHGVFSYALPSIPANTPVNWTGIATGAHPGTHGITDYILHLPRQPLDKTQDSYHSHLVNAEQIWHTADKVGKRAIVVNYPCAYPTSMKNGIFVGGEGRPESGSIFELKSACCFVSEKSAESAINAKVVNFTNSKGIPQTKIRLVPNKGAEPHGPGFDVRLVASQSRGYDTAEIGTVTGGIKASLRPRKWSDWLVDRFVVDGRERRGWFRLYLSELSPDGQRFKLYCTQIFPEDGYTKPDEIGRELVQAIGPYLEYCGRGPLVRHWQDIGAAFDEWRYQGLWLAKAGSYLMERYNGDLLYSQFHMLDLVFHCLWGGFDPISAWYKLESSAEYEEWILEAHKIVDEMVGIFIDGAGEDTVFVAVSDHGLVPTIKAVSINNLLAREGLISCKPGPHNKPIVDWGNTVAYKSTDAAHIWISLKGREPDGIVDEADYEHVQERIIDILLSLRDKQNGKRPVALALKKRDAALFGLWGERVGDVMFLMNDEYIATQGTPLTNDGRVIIKMGPEELSTENFPSAVNQAYHGCTLPTNQIGRGSSEMGLFVICGPGVRRGIRRDVPIRLIDVAPTIAHILAIPRPAHAEGLALCDLLIC